MRRRMDPVAVAAALVLGAVSVAAGEAAGEKPREREAKEGPAREAGPSRADDEKKKATPEIEVVVTATRTKHPLMESDRSITLIPERRLAERSAGSILDSLDDQPGIWIFKRNVAESDPVIRGFSGAFVLALVDGDTLTTLWGEGGEGMDDMYGKIESDSIERIEVIRGPASLAYGSNSLGGVINFITRECPFDYTEPGQYRFGGRYKFSAGTAADEYRGRAEQWFAAPRLRFFMGGAALAADDVRAGGGRLQRVTGAEHREFDANAEIKLADEHFLELTFQHMDRDNVFRYHRANQVNSNDRDAGHLLYAYRTDGWLRELAFKSYYQYKKDRRWWTDVDEEGYSRWDTFQESLQADMRFGTNGEHRVVAGLAFQADLGVAPDDEQFFITRADGSKIKQAPDSQWYDYGIFATHEWKATDDLTLSCGVRVDYFPFYSDVDRHYRAYIADVAPLQDPEIDGISAYKTIPSAGAGFNYRLHDAEPEVRLFGNYSRGFRLNPPVFGMTQHAQGVRIPSPLLEPITGDSFELGVRNFGTHMHGSFAGYYSSFDNFQAMRPSTFNGSDWFDWNGDGVRQPDEAIIMTQNVGGAYMWGIEWQQDFRIDQWLKTPGHLWVGGGFAYNYGEDDTDDPIRFTHPMWGLAKLRWEQGDLWKDSVVKDLYFEYVARMVRHFDRIPAGFLTDDRSYLNDPRDGASGLLRPFGLPGYSVHDFRCGLRVTDRVRLSLGIENIGDKKYRAAHGRMDGPGRNFWLSFEFVW